MVLGKATVPHLAKPEEILDNMELVLDLCTYRRFLVLDVHHSILLRALLHLGKDTVAQGNLPLYLFMSVLDFRAFFDPPPTVQPEETEHG